MLARPLQGRARLVPFVVWLMVASMLAGLVVSVPAVRAEGPGLIVDEVESYFPASLVFRFAVQPDRPIARARLNYTVGRDGASSYVYVPLSEDGTTGELELRTRGGGYIPPMAEIRYWYELEYEDGEVSVTEPRAVWYEDRAFDWQYLERDGLVVYYHELPAERAEQILAVGIETVAAAYDRFGIELINPVAIVVYNSLDEMRRALPWQGPVHENGLITLGQAHPDRDVVLVLDFDVDEQSLFETTRHELQHVITSQASKSPYSQIPVWLSEGLSVFAEESDAVHYLDVVDRARRNGTLRYLRDLAQRPSDPEQQLLVYGQGYLVVKYLHETYGADSIRQLLEAFKQGQGTDEALTTVFGKALDEIDSDWRATIGLPKVPPRSRALPSGTPIAVPTVVPLGS